ncbi:MAG TPA: DUF4010 domain-containing protein, partial [Vicinamibacterales bacterium]|nr:DUF4010 domain-containing protein [Vicinamibacterales bacterium]
LTALLLLEKTRLHALVARLDDESLRAGLRFAVMAIVILPLLPPGPFGPYDAIRPRALWMLVLFFSGLSFVGYIARRAVGPGHGDVVAGLLGGIVSSTSVTITFARTSRSTAANAGLGAGVVAACTVMYVRVLVAVAVLHLPLVWTLMRYFALPFVAGIVATVLFLRVQRESVAAPPPRNPLALAAALQMALLFQVVLLGISVVREQWGTGGMLVSGALLGLTDMDALTISMAHQAAGGLDLGLAARATAVGTVSNAALKLLIAAAVGKGEFRPIAVLGIAVIGITGGIAVALW